MKRITTSANKAALGKLCMAAAMSLALPVLAEPAATEAAAKDSKVSKASKAKNGPESMATEPLGNGRTEFAPAMQLAEGKSNIVRLPYPATRVAVGDNHVADVILLNPRELYILGRAVGTTNLILWQKSGDTVIADLTVSLDTVALQDGIDKLTGAKGIVRVSSAADSLILTGTVPDVVMADRVISMTNAYLSRNRALATQAGAQQQQQPQNSSSSELIVSTKIINMMTVAAPQQVMLEVKVAEVSKSLVDQLGTSLGVSHAIGNWTYTLLSNLLTGNPGVADAFNRRNGNFLTIDAQKRDGLVKMLAEPNLMAISGQEASFLAGGKIFIPVAQTAANGASTITLEEKEFGVAVRFTPTVLEGGRINLKVAPEVSELNKDGIGVTATGINGTAILPSFTTRRAATVVQLYDGQSFAIGGLIKNNTTTNVKTLPFLGEVPVLGALFRSNDFQTDRSELVFVITPRLVKPLPPGYEDKLPTAGYVDPSRAERLLMGKMEGDPSPANTPAQQTDRTGKPAGGFDLN
ncbi:type II and III secretion system protein family protein [Pseudoduganella sp. RAF19]|uniref:type II and III secretion system protein family protein n=1 Tax=Pseudoduganella sp. RAF19 TaxID=3233052 RepID=UPI003F966D44